MRPICADKLKEHYAWWENSDNAEYKKFKKVFDEIIDQQPTLNTSKKNDVKTELEVGDTCYAIYVTIQYDYATKPKMRGVYSMGLLNLYAGWAATGKNNAKLYPQPHNFVKSDYMRMGKFVFETEQEAQNAIDKVIKTMKEGKE